MALKSLRQQKNQTAARRIDDYPEPTIDPAHEREVQDWVTQGLNQLPAEQRLTLELAYHMRYPLQEIAVITDSRVGSIRAHIFYARGTSPELSLIHI